MSDHIRDKILRLLAKAQATDYEAEALAFAAKAQELMTQYAIDVALSDERHRSSSIGSTEIPVEDPYASARFSLMSAVAVPNRCRAIWDKRSGVAHLIGTDHDRAHVSMLYTSLLLQATSAMTAHGTVIDASGRNRTRSYRQAFLIGYAGEVRGRLEEATAAVIGEAVPGVLPVLASSEADVEEEMRRRFPRLRTHRPSVSSGTGLTDGATAGQRADLGTASFGSRTPRRLTG